MQCAASKVPKISARALSLSLLLREKETKKQKKPKKGARKEETRQEK
jgi:hypothetical protein